jgi:hypothetical protein
MELIRTAEVIGNIAEKAYHVGSFVVDKLKGGAWGETAESMDVPVTAQMHYFNSEERKAA